MDPLTIKLLLLAFKKKHPDKAVQLLCSTITIDEKVVSTHFHVIGPDVEFFNAEAKVILQEGKLHVVGASEVDMSGDKPSEHVLMVQPDKDPV